MVIEIAGARRYDVAIHVAPTARNKTQNFRLYLFLVIMVDTPDKPRYWLNILRHELFQQVLPWWLNKSLDKEGGGYFNCIYEDGSLFDTTKYIWLQGRQVWMLAKIYGDPKYDDRFFQDQGLSEINNQ